MRIKLLVGVCTSILMLIGCESKMDKSPNEDKVIQQQASGKNVEKMPTEQRPSLKTEEETSYILYNSDIHHNAISYFAVIKNESGKSLDVSQINISYTDKDGDVIGSNDSSSIHVSPYILKPGQRGYVSAEINVDVAYNKYGSASMTVSPVITSGKVKSLPIDKHWMKTEDNHIVYLNGKTKNTTDKPLECITVGAAIYGNNDEFIGTTFDSKKITLNPGQSISFESISPKISDQDLSKVKRYEVRAYAYSSN